MSDPKSTALHCIKVAVGVLVDGENRVLIGQRTARDAYYQQWEFPGGKLESGESPAQALKRELAEELGIQVAESEPIMEWQHHYPDRFVHLFVERVTQYQGEPRSKENQALKWVALDEIEHIDFLAGNQAIVDRLRKVL